MRSTLILFILILFTFILLIPGSSYIKRNNYEYTNYNSMVYETINFNKKIVVKDIKIGVIDVDFDGNHPNLNLIPINLSKVRPSNDIHGNVISGIIGATPSKINDFSGLLPGTNIYIYELEKNNLKSLEKAIREYIKYDIDIINISLATTKFDEELLNVVNEAIAAGIVIVASAGNDGNMSLSYPASFETPGVISVGSINNSFNIMPSSNTNEQVDIWAPGENIFSLDKQYENINMYSGTSVATSIVTSLVAIIKSNCHIERPKNIENLIKDGAFIYTGKWKSQTRSILLVDFDNTINICSQMSTTS